MHQNTLYPLSHYVSLNHLSPDHKNFIMGLHTIYIPNTVFEALTKRELMNAVREEMEALKRTRFGKLLRKQKGRV